MSLEIDDALRKSSVSNLIQKLAVMCKKPTVDCDLSGVLDEFVRKLQESQIYLSNGIFTTNFGEAAIFLESAVSVYGKKIDLLWDMLLDYQKRMLSYDKKSNESRAALTQLEERRQKYKRKRIKDSNIAAEDCHGEAATEAAIAEIIDRLDDDAFLSEEYSFENNENLMKHHDMIYTKYLPKQTSLKLHEPYSREAYITINCEIFADKEYLCNNNQFMADRHLFLIPEHSRQMAYNLFGKRNIETVGYDVRDKILQKFLVEKNVTNLGDNDVACKVNAYIKSFLETHKKPHTDLLEQHKKLFMRRSSILLTRLPDDVVQSYLKSDESKWDELASDSSDQSTNLSIDTSESGEEGKANADQTLLEENVTDAALNSEKLATATVNNNDVDSGFLSQTSSAISASSMIQSTASDSGFFQKVLLDSINDVALNSEELAMATVNKGGDSGFLSQTSSAISGSTIIQSTAKDSGFFQELLDSINDVADTENDKSNATNNRFTGSCDGGDSGVPSEADFDLSIREPDDCLFDTAVRIVTSTPKSSLKACEMKCIIEVKKSVERQKLSVLKRKLNIADDETEDIPMKKVRKRRKIFKWLKTITTTFKSFEKFYYRNYILEDGEGCRLVQDFSDSEQEDEIDMEPSPVSNSVYERVNTVALNDLDVTQLTSESPQVDNPIPIAQDLSTATDEVELSEPLLLSADYASKSTHSDPDQTEVVSKQQPVELARSSLSIEHVDSITYECSKPKQNKLDHITEYSEEFNKILRERQAMQNRYCEWKAFIDRKLSVTNKKEFDIHDYGTMIVNMLPEGEPMKFRDIMKGKPSSEVVRYFIASLQLANAYNIELSRPKEVRLTNDSLKLKLLTKERYHENLVRYEAPSKEALQKNLACVRAMNMSSCSVNRPKPHKRRKLDY